MAEPVTKLIEGLTFVSRALPPFRSIDLLPELAAAIGGAAAKSATDLDMVIAVIRGLGAGKLRELLPKILAGTTVTVTNHGAPQKVALTSVEAIDLAFDGNMKALPQAIALALEVSFGDFFAGFGLAAEAYKAKAVS